MIGIYFLIRNKKIIYIGKSIDVMRRLKEHCQCVWFTQFRVIPCDIRKISEYEKRLIKYFKPVLNNKHNATISNYNKFRFMGKRGRRISIKNNQLLVKKP